MEQNNAPIKDSMFADLSSILTSKPWIMFFQNLALYSAGKSIPIYANNAAAIAGGLKVGQFYRVNAAVDPEPLYVVH